ncbi:hypothetical protein TRFO_34645 [Tritrichomonas foetus]|uniref:Uncharacterized protein n=1 Tax=Tritrichomonas foetus TaxID=1144522 RepID=A0A1J4JIM2_9EUKA|nr:hypothetical protein TRFO_34645 [Tritrichomonas foetus]|eukprot:OHS98994.1 hypothetical protein TRFO_34645 [Tritrichomonas foetus]
MSLKQAVLKSAKLAIDAKTAFMLSLPNRLDRVIDRGYEFLFSYYDTSVNQTSTFPPKPRPKEPLLPPYDDHLEVCHMKDGASHYIIINKFMAKFGHLVMSTDYENAQQGEPLDKSDFITLSRVMNGFDGKGLGLYNSGTESGCTQLHKHMQYVPTDENPILQNMISHEKMPFKYYIEKMNNLSSDEIAECYKKLMADANYKGSYNFMIFNNHGFLVPRTHARHPSGKVINALGVAGHWTIFERMANTIIKQHPMTVLEELCVKV